MMILLNASPNSPAIEKYRYHPCLAGMIQPRSWQVPTAWTELGKPWALDNDCFQGLNEEAFVKMLIRFRGLPGCLWVTAPDVVGNASATLAQFKAWEPTLRSLGYPIALVAQNGLEDLEVPWSQFDCLFIGGDTAWKLGPAAEALVKEAKARGKLVHMGRVNTRRRMEYAISIGCDSVDGTGLCRFSRQTLPWALGMAGTVQSRMELVS